MLLKKWLTNGLITAVRTTAYNTIVSYELDMDSLVKTRHPKFLRKVKA